MDNGFSEKYKGESINFGKRYTTLEISYIIHTFSPWLCIIWGKNVHPDQARQEQHNPLGILIVRKARGSVKIGEEWFERFIQLIREK